MYAALSPLQTRSLSEEKIRSLSRMSCASTRCPCRPSWACLFFSAYPQFLLIPLSLNGDHTSFSHLGSPLPFNSSTTGSHSFNGAGNPFCWCHFPTLVSKSQTGSHTGFSLFCSVSLPTFPLRGKAGLFSNLGCAGFARLAHNCPTRLQQGRSGAFLASFPYLALKTGHRATQGRVWFHRRFLVRFFCGSPASWRSRW